VNVEVNASISRERDAYRRIHHPGENDEAPAGAGAWFYTVTNDKQLHHQQTAVRQLPINGLFSRSAAGRGKQI